MVRCKMTQGRVTEVPCLLDLTIGLRLTLANMSEQSLKKMGFSWSSWTSQMAKSIFEKMLFEMKQKASFQVCREKRQFDEEH